MYLLTELSWKHFVWQIICSDDTYFFYFLFWAGAELYNADINCKTVLAATAKACCGLFLFLATNKKIGLDPQQRF